MRALRPVLTALLTLVLLAQSGLAAAHCLAMAVPVGHETVICSPEGTRTIRVAEDGRALDDAPRHGGSGSCVSCPLPFAVVPDRAPAVSVPVAWVPAPPPVFASAAVLRPPARAPPYAPRGPPASA